jgi:DNA ligase (NAD+)
MDKSKKKLIKGKKTTKKVKPIFIEVSTFSSSSSSKRRKTAAKSKTLKKPKLKPRRLKRSPIFLIESTSSSSSKAKENGKIDLKNSAELNVDTSMKNGERLNEKFIDMLEKLSKIMISRGEVHRARAYQKAQETIMAFPDTITDPKQLSGKPAIGSTIMEKMNELVETGTLRIIEREKENPINIFTEIYGVGPKKAKDLVDKGIKTISQLREKEHVNELNDIQRVGLKYYEDVLQRIPRQEIEEYRSIFEKVKPDSTTFEIVGSYRRGAETSGDIDVIITSKNSKDFAFFVDLLIEGGMIKEVLSRGPSKCLVIAKLKDAKYARRVDFLYASPEEYPFSILYFTGSKSFNTMMRHRALTMGYSMNEHGMYRMDARKKGDKVAHVFGGEKDIFDFLNMEYKAPNERIDGRSVVDAVAVAVAQEEAALASETEEIIIVPKAQAQAQAQAQSKSKTLKKGLVKKQKSVKNNSVETLVVTDNSEVNDLVRDFKKNGISVLESLSESQLSEMVRVANEAYRNMEPIMTDNEYDIVQDYVAEKFPANLAVKQIGAPVEKNKATLPYAMGSMDKIKPDSGALATWMQKYRGPYVLSCKLDGVSGLYTTEGKEPKLYTRGDGRVGQDITHLIPYLRLPKDKNIVLRGEFILPKAVFEEKYKTQFANPRNLVSGIVNRVTIDEKVKDLNFVAYEVIKPELKPSEQMGLLATLDVNVVMNKVVTGLTNEILSELLVDWRKNYVYEIDGVIVTDDVIVARKFGNPEHSFAFKMVLSDQIAEAKVVDVLWSPSKDGYLKPRVQIEPIQLGGVKIEYATGFNAAFIQERKIGIGALIQLVRSGDVIPHIKDVTMPAEEAKMPGVPYKWNESHVDIMLEDATDDLVVREKNLTGFFKGIGVDGLSSGNIARIMDTGNDTIPKIIHMTKADFLNVEGFKEKLATKIHEGIRDRLAAASLLTIMSASNILGRGISEKKIEPILQAFPDILTSQDSAEEKTKKVMSVKGMAKKTAELFVANIPAFLEFIKECGLEHLLSQPSSAAYAQPILEGHVLNGKSIVMTGFRDESLGESLKKVGAKLGSSVSKNTFAVLVKDKEEDTGKANEARKLGIPIYTLEEFKTKYLSIYKV